MPIYNPPQSAVNVFRSTQQVITAAGQIVLPHGLGRIPDIVEFTLVNLTAELGYVPGDLVVAAIVDNSGAGRGNAVTLDNTNITVRFGASGAFVLANKTTGTGNNILNNANWRLIVSAL